MPLFDTAEGEAPSGYNQRSGIIRESGTRRILFGIIALTALSFVYAKINDAYLLKTRWKPLVADTSGLTIVGTLDSRADYDANMFQIVNTNKMTRVQLTEFGKKSIFPDMGNDGALFRSSVYDTISYARKVDSETAFAMLEPYLKIGVARAMKQTPPTLTETTLITITRQTKEGQKEEQAELGKLIAKYDEDARAEKSSKDDESEGFGSGTSQEVKDGLILPGITVARSCPVVLTAQHFTDASIEEQPESLLQNATYKIHLGLTSEGRSRFYQWSRDHAGENMVFVLNGDILLAGRVSQTLNVSDWTIGPVFDGEYAKRLADFVNKKPMAVTAK